MSDWPWKTPSSKSKKLIWKPDSVAGTDVPASKKEKRRSTLEADRPNSCGDSRLITPKWWFLSPFWPTFQAE